MSQAIAAPVVRDASEPPDQSLDAPVFGRHNLITAAVLFGVALVSLLVIERIVHINVIGVSGNHQYIAQAQSLLRGHWDLDPGMKGARDVVISQGKYYIVYPPFPAILLMPFVALFGDKTSDILFTTVMSAINLPLLYLLFEQVRANGLTRRSWRNNLAIAVLLYYGSINLWLSLGGSMWFTAQITCLTFTMLSLLVAFRRHYAWSAVLLGCAFFSRSTVALGFPFLFYLAWDDAGAQPLLKRFAASLWARKPDWSAFPWRRLVAPVGIAAAVVVLFMAHAYVLFGTPFESGYNILIHQHYATVTDGPFNIKYVPANIIANFFTFPLVTFTGPFDRHPVFDMLNQRFAVSVFVTTPLFLFLFWRNRRVNLLRAMLWVTIGLVVVAVLLFHASGWQQFGARYLFDGYAYAFLLLALNEVRVDWRFFALGALAIVINLMGAHQFWTWHILHL